MKIKKGFVLRTVCGENVIVGEGLDAYRPDVGKVNGDQGRAAVERLGPYGHHSEFPALVRHNGRNRGHGAFVPYRRDGAGRDHLVDDAEGGELLVRRQVPCHAEDLAGPEERVPTEAVGSGNGVPVAVEEGSTMVRIGSSIFGPRDYSNLKK